MNPQAPENIKPLTSLRFFAALWVATFTYWPSLGVASPAFVQKGYLGVELFFVLSGFILSHVYMERFKNGTYNYGEFIWARLARVYPLHLGIIIGLGLLIAALAAAGVHAGDKLIIWSSLPAHLTLTHAWGLGQGGGWNDPSWSISAEWFAYVTFPAFAFVACKFWNRPRLAVAAALAAMIPIYIGFQAITGELLTEATIRWGALRIVPCFALGCSLWLLWRSDVVKTERNALIVAATALLLLAGFTTAGAPDWMTVAACGGIVFGLGALGRSGSTLLSNKVLIYLGEVSYAVYMVCVPWKLVCTEGLQKAVGVDPNAMPISWWLVMFVGVVPAAMLLHHTIERPARNLMRKHAPRFSAKAARDAHTAPDAA